MRLGKLRVLCGEGFCLSFFSLFLSFLLVCDYGGSWKSKYLVISWHFFGFGGWGGQNY